MAIYTAPEMKSSELTDFVCIFGLLEHFVDELLVTSRTVEEISIVPPLRPRDAALVEVLLQVVCHVRVAEPGAQFNTLQNIRKD